MLFFFEYLLRTPISHSMYRANLIFLLLFTAFICFKPLGSLADTGPADSVLVMKYVQHAFDAINKASADSAKWYANRAIRISEKCGFLKGVAWGYHRLSQIYDYTGLPDSALMFGKKAESIFRETGENYGLARSLYTLGNIYLYKSWYETALKYYTASHSVFSEINNLSGTNDCYAGLALVYFYREEWRNCIRYLNLTAEYEKKTNDEEGLPETWFNLGCAYYKLGLNDSAVYFYKQAEGIAEKNKNIRVLSATANNMGEIELARKKYSEAIRYFNQSIALKNQMGFYDAFGESFINLGMVYMQTGDFQKATEYINDGIEYCRQYHANEGLAVGYHTLSKLYEKTGNHASALSAYKEYVKVNDILNNMRFAGQVAEWQTLYHLKDTEFQLETAKSQVMAQQADLRMNKLMLTGLIALSVVIILISFLVYRNMKNKNTIVRQNMELQENRIRQLENEKVLLATQSVMKGEETERRRLARDLHDGIGGMLSGVKLAFSNIKHNNSIPENLNKDYDHALGLLDTTIAELRRVARNLLPEALLKLGLKSSIADFCAELNKVNDVEITFQYFGNFERLDSNLELNTFRVVQELVNNAIKHARARQLVVQIIQEPQRLCCIVQDDGIGFNGKEVKAKKGIGLSTVRSRIEALNGTLEMISTPGNGTEFTVEFPLNRQAQKAYA